MSPNISLISDGKKFMWDGLLYDAKEDASRAGQVYQNDGFQIRIVEEGEKFLVYTRRPVREAAVAAQ
jgi:hypothetical protein